MRRIETRRGTEAGPSEAPRTYYRYPAMKEPTWGWEVVTYFFLGGIAAGSHLVATLAHIFGTPEDRAVSRAGRYLALAAVAISPFLLVADLGRPGRWRNMLRIFKTRSPMSTGSWGLASLGLFAGLGAARQAVDDGVIGRDSLVAQVVSHVPHVASGILGTVSAFFVGSYTGVLLSFTNAPLWARNRWLQGPLYLTSALSTGLAAITTVLAAAGNIPRRTRRWLGWAEDAAAVGEVGLTAGTIASLGPRARPLTRPRYALPLVLGTLGLGIVLPFILRRNLDRASPREMRGRMVASGLSALLGGLIFRWVTVMAGRESAREPKEYFAFTKEAGHGR